MTHDIHRHKPVVAIAHLPRIMLTDGGSSSSDGVTVSSYGQGQVAGGTFTVPAHSQIDVDFQLQLSCITPSDIASLTALIRGMIAATHRSLFDDVQTASSGGSSWFGFWGSHSSSSGETRHTMDSWGLSPTNQDEIITAMLAIANKTNTFSYKGTVFNKDFDYDVTGNLFGIVMDATITQGSTTQQQRYVAPSIHLTSSDGSGDTLPTVGKLY